MARRPPPVPEPIDADEVVRVFRELGTYAAVARELGCHPETVQRRLAARGIHRRRRDRRGPAALYSAWWRMVRSCTDPGHAAYPSHGGMGIRVSAHWAQSFERFKAWALDNGWKPGRVLARKGGKGHFTPGNCRWTTRSDKQRGRELPPRRLVPAFGERKGIAEWSRDRRCLVGYAALMTRLTRGGWPPEEAISLPAGARPSRRCKARGGRSGRGARPQVDWAEAMRRVVEGGESRSRVAGELGVPLATLSWRLARAGVVIRPRRRKRPEDDPLYLIWLSMRRHARVQGGMQLIVPEWDDHETFRVWARRNGYRRGLNLVCLDKNRGWSPQNCRFVPRREIPHYCRPVAKHRQRRPVWTVEAFGEEKGPTEWSRDRRCAVSLATLLRRLRGGWDPGQALTAPTGDTRRPPRPRRPITAFGETKGITAWSRDPRCKVTYPGLHDRLRRGIPPEEALTARPWEHGHPSEAQKPARSRSRRKKSSTRKARRRR